MPLKTENFFIDNPNLNEIIILTPPHFNSFNFPPYRLCGWQSLLHWYVT